MLRFIVGNVADFDSVGIDITSERESIDNTKSLKHIELLSDEQFETVRFDKRFEFLSDENLEALIATSEWNIPE